MKISAGSTQSRKYSIVSILHRALGRTGLGLPQRPPCFCLLLCCLPRNLSRDGQELLEICQGTAKNFKINEQQHGATLSWNPGMLSVFYFLLFWLPPAHICINHLWEHEYVAAALISLLLNLGPDREINRLIAGQDVAASVGVTRGQPQCIPQLCHINPAQLCGP